MTAYAVRPAVPGDAEALGDVHTRVWREAYRGLMPADHLASLDPVASARGWRTALERPDRTGIVLVATADGAVVGFAGAGRSRDDPPVPARELYALNVLAAHHGTGLADRLLAGTLAPCGHGAVSLWVVEGNVRARAFYRRNGFVPDGRRQHHEGTGTPEMRLVRPAASG